MGQVCVLSVQQVRSVPSPQFANWLPCFAFEALSELSRIRHRAQNARKFGGMRVEVDSLNCRLLPRLPAPPIGVVDKEQLFLRKEVQSGKILVCFFGAALLPRLECSRQATRISDILAQCKATVNMQGLVTGPGDSEVGVLLDETFCSLLEVFDCLVGPLFCCQCP